MKAMVMENIYRVIVVIKEMSLGTACRVRVATLRETKQS